MAAKGKMAKSKQESKAANDMAETLAAFTLPDSLPCSEVSFPVLIQRATKANWKNILKESDQRFHEIDEFVESRKELIPLSPFQKTESEYVKNEVFTHLLPVLEETLNKAKLWNVFYDQRSFFNGIDWIAQELWNNNPRYPIRKDYNLHLFNMPWVRKHLAEHPRPLYPKSWLWPEEYAATLIQKTLRQYFVQREDEVQEMRDFWRKLEVEHTAPDIHTNPFLAKKFASERNVSSGKTK